MSGHPISMYSQPPLKREPAPQFPPWTELKCIVQRACTFSNLDPPRIRIFQGNTDLCDEEGIDCTIISICTQIPAHCTCTIQRIHSTEKIKLCRGVHTSQVLYTRNVLAHTASWGRGRGDATWTLTWWRLGHACTKPHAVVDGTKCSKYTIPVH